MSRIAIYHMTHQAFFQGKVERAAYGTVSKEDTFETVLTGIIDSSYVRVAEVEAETLESAWDLTGEDSTWPSKHEVLSCFGARQRSSMMGDIFVYNDEAYAVASCGFKPLGKTVAYLMEVAVPKGSAVYAL